MTQEPPRQKVTTAVWELCVSVVWRVDTGRQRSGFFTAGANCFFNMFAKCQVLF